MSRTYTVAATAALTALLGFAFASADTGNHDSTLEEFTALADANEGFPYQTYRSSDIIGPVFHVNSWDTNNTDDAPYLFIGAVYGQMKSGPMILDARDLSLVYADQQYENAYTSSVQNVNGTNYLMFWEGSHTRGHANGFCRVYDEQYVLRYNVTAQNLHGALADMHEVKMTQNHTIIFTTYFNIPYDCTPVGGPSDSLLMDSGFQEVDAATNELLFDWHASEHFDIADTIVKYSPAYGVSDDSGLDFFHINSVEKTEDGNYLVSSRHMSHLTLIDGTDGHPIWILGGRYNQFKDLSDGEATNFGWQHDARFFENQSHITMFDNHGEHTGRCKEGGCRSRGLHLEIDAQNMTARLIKEYYHPEGVDAGAMGGFQQLDNGNVMVSWGHSPGFVEYTYDGQPVLDVQRGKLGQPPLEDMFAYRVQKNNWTGRPRWPPSVAVDEPYGTTVNATLYLSWNGATDIDTWAVFGSHLPLEVHRPNNFIAHVNRTGFETEVPLPGDNPVRYIGAAAVDKNGDVLGSSFVFDIWTQQPVMMPSYIETMAEESCYSKNAAGIGGGGVLFMVVVAGGILWLWRRRRFIWPDAEKAMYRRVKNDE